jgi:Fe-S cluster assembly protein SufD
MTAFLQQAQTAQTQLELEGLDKKRYAAQQVLEVATWPTRKTEAWKYTRLNVIEKQAYQRPFSGELPSREELSSLLEIEGLAARPLVFVNGHFSPDLSRLDDLEAGLELKVFSQGGASAHRFNANIDLHNHLFSAINTLSCDDGLEIRVKANHELNEILHVCHITTPGSESFHANTRIVIELEANSQARVIEHFVSSEARQNVLTNCISEIFLADNAKLRHYRIHEEEEHSVHLGGIHSELAASAELNSFYLALGASLQRFDVVSHINGAGAHCEMNGVYLPVKKEVVDFHTCVEHKVAHGTSNENFRGIVADESRAVFNGRIHIHKDAQKTSAMLSNKNLLTSNKAEVDTKPELEIYADDVRCAHGATVAQLDTEGLHYFKTRGIAEEEARVMLSFGFINELLNTLDLDALAAYLRPKLAARFARDPELARHIA